MDSLNPLVIPNANYDINAGGSLGNVLNLVARTQIADAQAAAQQQQPQQQQQQPAAPTKTAAQIAQEAADAKAKADETAYWNDQMSSLQQLLGRADTQQTQGLANIDQSYNNALTRTNEDQSTALSNYATQRAATQNSKLAAIDNVDTNARTGYQSLMRMLGQNGAGFSSAAQDLAPQAVSRQASGQRRNVFNTYGQNLQALDSAESNTKTQFQRAMDDLFAQSQEKRQSLVGGVLDTKNKLQQQLADAAVKKAMAGGADYTQARAARQPFQDAVNANYSALDNLTKTYATPTFTPKPVTAAAANLADYTVDPTATKVADAAPGSDPSVNPYLALLNATKKKTDLIGATA